jgi:hypothetical protein
MVRNGCAPRAIWIQLCLNAVRKTVFFATEACHAGNQAGAEFLALLAAGPLRAHTGRHGDRSAECAGVQAALYRLTLGRLLLALLAVEGLLWLTVP